AEASADPHRALPDSGAAVRGAAGQAPLPGRSGAHGGPAAPWSPAAGRDGARRRSIGGRAHPAPAGSATANACRGVRWQWLERTGGGRAGSSHMAPGGRRRLPLSRLPAVERQPFGEGSAGRRAAGACGSSGCGAPGSHRCGGHEHRQRGCGQSRRFGRGRRRGPGDPVRQPRCRSAAALPLVAGQAAVPPRDRRRRRPAPVACAGGADRRRARPDHPRRAHRRAAPEHPQSRVRPDGAGRRAQRPVRPAAFRSGDGRSAGGRARRGARAM
ncbi:MAG: hypothetical protein AVDCRST_MAG31-1302, partial [uncultured Sphingomonas sp.]